MLITMTFADFDDHWKPFPGGQGPAAAHVTSLAPAGVEALRERLREDLAAAPAGSIVLLPARPWAVRGTRAHGCGAGAPAAP